MFLASGSRLGQANTLQALGDVHYMRDEYEQAVARYQEALPLYEAIGARYSIANLWARWARVHYALGEVSLACEKTKAALSIVESLGYTNQGWVNYWRNELAEWGCDVEG